MCKENPLLDAFNEADEDWAEVAVVTALELDYRALRCATNAAKQNRAHSCTVLAVSSMSTLEYRAPTRQRTPLLFCTHSRGRTIANQQRVAGSLWAVRAQRRSMKQG